MLYLYKERKVTKITDIILIGVFHDFDFDFISKFCTVYAVLQVNVLQIL